VLCDKDRADQAFSALRRAFAFLVSLEIFLAALFLCMMPLDVALLIVFTAAPSAACTTSLLFSFIAASTAFAALFILDRSRLFRTFFFSDCLALFKAERLFFGADFAAKFVSSLENSLIFYHKVCG
jgi:hypothetical protein